MQHGSHGYVQLDDASAATIHEAHVRFFGAVRQLISIHRPLGRPIPAAHLACALLVHPEVDRNRAPQCHVVHLGFLAATLAVDITLVVANSATNGALSKEVFLFVGSADDPIQMSFNVGLLVLLGMVRIWLKFWPDQAKATRIGTVAAGVFYMVGAVLLLVWMVLLATHPVDSAEAIETICTASAESTSTSALLSLNAVMNGVLMGSWGFAPWFSALLVATGELSYASQLLLCETTMSFVVATLVPMLLFALSAAAMRAYELALRAAFQEGQLRLKAHEQLASYLFHELRNDMNATTGALEQIYEAVTTGHSTLPADVWAITTDAVTHAHHASSVVANMLDFAQLRASKLVLPRETVRVQDVFDESATLVKHLLRGKADAVRLDVQHAAHDGSAIPRVLCSRAHLLQVLVNLLTNACKYTERGQIVLSAHLVPSPDCVQVHTGGSASPRVPDTPPLEAATIRFAVRDTGVGMSDALRSRLFEPFEKGYKPGTGLGLPLANELVRLMGGQLTVSSSPSGGSQFSFTLTLPLAMEHEAARAQTTVNAKAAGAEGAGGGFASGLRLLVADDSKVNRAILIRSLRKLLPSPVVTEATSGEEALERLTSSAFDIAFLDQYYSSSADALVGTDVTRRYREAELSTAAPTRRLLILGITGNSGDPEHRALAAASGQDAVWGRVHGIPTRAPYLARSLRHLLCLCRPLRGARSNPTLAVSPSQTFRGCALGCTNFCKHTQQCRRWWKVLISRGEVADQLETRKRNALMM